MSKAQNTVIWLGLILITLNLLVNIGELKSVLFGGGASTTANTTPTNNASTPPQTSTPAQTPPSVQTPSGVQAV